MLTLPHKLLLLYAVFPEDCPVFGGLSGVRPKLFFCDKPSSVYAAVRKLVRGGDLRVMGRGERKTVKISLQGRRRLFNLKPMLRWAGRRWDGVYRIVTFDVPEARRPERDAVRQKLLDLGFGRWQRSVYVSAYPLGAEVKLYLEKIGLAGESLVMEAKNIYQPDAAGFPRRVWNLDSLENRYDEFTHKLASGIVGAASLLDEFLEIFNIDPLLPDKLLPEMWAGKEAVKLISKKMNS